MADLIIRDASDLATYFENIPTRTYGRSPSYSVVCELSNPTIATGYNAVQRAAERINARGDNLRADEMMAGENWDSIDWSDFNE